MAARKNGPPKLPWTTRLPRGLREQPGWVFIGLLVGLAGVGYLTGLGQSNITEAVGTTGLRIWGGFLALAGFGVVYATMAAKPALEKLALRWLSLCMFVYTGWLMTVAPLSRLAMTTVLVAALIGFCEIRVATLKWLLRAERHVDQ